jgi:hypothetical protein
MVQKINETKEQVARDVGYKQGRVRKTERPKNRPNERLVDKQHESKGYL